uniref:Uncharacterized protein n=1 Tax=Panagrolaimus davidi TaxID=227884 RepID=A0A914PDX9_9BILA
MIDTVTPDDKNANTEFNKRLFVQYLWRNAKPYEKARVQKEFDPRRQRLLRFVGDKEQKKKAMKPSTSATTSSSAASAWRRLAGGGSAPPTSSGRPTSRGSVASEGRPRQPQKTSRTSSTSSSRGKKPSPR